MKIATTDVVNVAVLALGYVHADMDIECESASDSDFCQGRQGHHRVRERA
jgi:hypothetical protein